jgi:CBS domain-containing protein
VACIGEGETLRQAGHRMRELGVAVLAVCGEDGRLQWILTQDMVVGSIAAGGDPKTVTVGEAASRALSAGPNPGWQGTGLRIGELANAIRAAADAVSRPGAVEPVPRMPGQWPSVQAAQRYGCHAA